MRWSMATTKKLETPTFWTMSTNWPSMCRMFEFDTAASTARSFATLFTVSQISGYVSQFVGHASPSFAK